MHGTPPESPTDTETHTTSAKEMATNLDDVGEDGAEVDRSLHAAVVRDEQARQHRTAGHKPRRDARARERERKSILGRQEILYVLDNGNFLLHGALEERQDQVLLAGGEGLRAGQQKRCDAGTQTQLSGTAAVPRRRG